MKKFFGVSYGVSLTIGLTFFVQVWGLAPRGGHPGPWLHRILGAGASKVDHVSKMMTSEVKASVKAKLKAKVDTTMIKNKVKTKVKAAPIASELVELTEAGGRPHTDESRAKISAANKGKVPWNAGKAHSEETRMKISIATREGMMRRKLQKLATMGMTMEDYDINRIEQKKKKKRAQAKGGLTEDGRRRISESVKERWKDPIYREQYSKMHKGARNHSEATRARISEAITLKWKDQSYREKVNKKPSAEVRARISETLKSKWKQEDFRSKMLSQQFPRTEEWRTKLSKSIKDKWQDPEYRASVEHGIRSSNKTSTRPHSSSPRIRARSSTPAPRPPRLSPDELRERKRTMRQEQRAKEKARKAAFVLAREDSKKTGSSSRLKELLGRELWFEEKLKRRVEGDKLLDDDALERMLYAEFSAADDDEEDEEDLGSQGSADDDGYDDDDGFESENDELDDELYDGPNYEDVIQARSYAGRSQTSSDVIEAYDEEGNLVGTYTDEEWEELKRRQR